jgi:hypothetical protein
MFKKMWKYIFNGSGDLKFNFFNRIIIGIKFILLIICVILTFTLVLAPATIPLGMVLFRSLTYKGQFVGIKNILLGLLFIVLIMLGIPTILSILIGE